MPIDPSIALGYKGIEAPNPLAQYAQLSQIQNAQNQNALAQFQLRAAQQSEADQQAVRNALKGVQFGTPEYEKALTGAFLGTGNVKGLQEYQKSQREADKAAIELKIKQQEHQRELFGNLAMNPSDENIKAHLQDMLIQKQITDQEANAWLTKTATMTPAQRTQLFSNLAQTAHQRVGHEVTIRGQNLVDARAREKNAQDATSVVYQQDANGNVVALPSKLKAGEVPKARVAVAPGVGMTPLTAKPSEAESKERISQNQLKSTIAGAIKAVEASPEAFGMSRGLQGEKLGPRLATEDENTNRSYVFNVVSGVIKERAGTAQSAAEHDTLMRFLPGEYDSADIIKSKLKGFEKYLADKEAGTTRQPTKSTGNAPSAGGKVAPPSGFVLDPQ